MPAFADDVSDAEDEYNAALATSEDLQGQVADTQSRIDELDAQIPEARKQAADAIVAAYKSQPTSGNMALMAAVLNSDSIGGVVSVLRYHSVLDTAEQEKIDGLLSQKQQLDEAKSQLEQESSDADAAADAAKEKYEDARAAAEKVANSSSGSSNSLSSDASAYERSGSGLTKSAGVNNYNGHRETYYSSRVLYHYMTPQWSLDSEGFWRTSEGYYVVAANSGEYSKGTLLDTSKGTAEVLDSGCAYGTLDFYVNW